MTDQQIPQRLDPFKQIGAGLDFYGLVELDKLTRLEGLLADQLGSVQVSLSFRRDEQDLTVVSGRAQVELNLICQRCHESGDYTVDSSFCFALLREESETDYLPEAYEPIVLDSPELDLYELIEEELILALPLVYYHEKGLKQSCDSLYKQALFGDLEAEIEEKPKPFAVLEKLKKDLKK